MVLVPFEEEILQRKFWAKPKVALGQMVGEVEEVVGEGEVLLQQEAAEVEAEGLEEWAVGVVEGVVVTELDCLEGTYPWVCWGTSGLEYV